MKSLRNFLKSKGNILLTVLLSGVFLCGCGKKQADNVNIAYFPNITHSQALVMKNQGSLESALGEGCSVNWVQFNAGPAEVSALFSGDIDIGYIGPTPAISANVKSKGDICIISGCSEGGMMLLAAPGSGIEEISDLASKNVAVPQIGNTQHVILLNLLSENGLSTVDSGGDVTITATANAYILQLMASGEIDAACVPEPWAETLIEECDAKVIADENEVWSQGSYPVAVVVVREQFMKDNPEIVAKFLAVHQEITEYLMEKPQEAMTIINEEIEQATGKSIEIPILEKSMQHLNFAVKVDKNTMNVFAQICMREGITESLPTDGLIHIK